MAGLPTLQVLLDDGSGTFPYDITSKCRLQYDVKRGRQDEQSDVTPGSLDLRLDNTDGRFTLGSTIIASPSPIKVDTRLRLKVTANAVTVNRHTGYAQSWPVEWPTGAQTLSEVTVSTTDAQARAERRVLQSIVEEAILVDIPLAYYPLGEPDTATSAADTSGNQVNALTIGGSGSPVVFGTDPGGSSMDDLTAVTFAGGQVLTGYLIGGGGGVLECGFTRLGNPATPEVLLLTGSGGNYLAINTNGKLTTTGADLTGSPVVTDGLAHTVSWQAGHVLVDGVDIGSPTNAPTAGILSVGGDPLGPRFGAVNLSGTISHVAHFASLGISNAHAAAYLTGFAGESGTARITRLAGYTHIPTGTLDTSLTNVPYEDLTNKSAAEALRDVADAEMGLLFVDGAGNLTFHNRQRVTTKTAPDITIDANQLAEDTQFAVDMQGVLNFIETTAQGTQIRQVARNTSSETSHGRYSTSKTYLVATDGEALDRANWILNAHAEPVARLGTLKIDMLTLTAAQQAALLAAEANTWIQVINLPSQTPGGTTADIVIQGFQDTLNAAGWALTANVVSKPAIFPSVWILGDATYGVLGSTTRLGV